MITSELIDKLSPALVLAQSQMDGAFKGAKNPFFKANYSDLASIMEAVSEPFAVNDLCFIQGAEYSEGRIAVATRIVHKSGQWIESTIELPAVKNDPQAYGSALTYAKRYGLQAMAGVPSVDDDGHAAVNTVAAKPVVNKLILKQINDAATVQELVDVWSTITEQSLYLAAKDTAKAKLLGAMP